MGVLSGWCLVGAAHAEVGWWAKAAVGAFVDAECYAAEGMWQRRFFLVVLVVIPEAPPPPPPAPPPPPPPAPAPPPPPPSPPPCHLCPSAASFGAVGAAAVSSWLQVQAAGQGLVDPNGSTATVGAQLSSCMCLRLLSAKPRVPHRAQAGRGPTLRWCWLVGSLCGCWGVPMLRRYSVFLRCQAALDRKHDVAPDHNVQALCHDLGRQGGALVCVDFPPPRCSREE
jgi:hypothetical protein